MATSINDNEKDRLLNVFPFRDEELNVLLKLAAVTCDDDDASSSKGAVLSSFSTWMESSRKNHEEEEKSVRHYHPLLPFVEQHVLPPSFSMLLLSTAFESVFVLSPQGHYDVFLEAMATCLGRRGPRSVLDLLFTMAQTNKNQQQQQQEQDNSNESPKTIPYILMDWIYRLTVSSHIMMKNTTGNDKDEPRKEHFENLQVPKAWIESLKSMVDGSSTQLSRPAWKQWVDETCPHLYTSLSSFMHQVVFSSMMTTASDCSSFCFRPDPLILPIDKDYFAWTTTIQPSNKNGNNHPSCHWSIPATLAWMGLGGPYQCLYSTERDGKSFRTMQQALWSFAGTTLLLIHTTEGDTLGYYTESPWKAGATKWFGSSEHDSFLFTLEPRVKIYPTMNTTGKKASLLQYQYLHLPPSHRKEQVLTGLAIDGVAPDRPRLHITESFERCTASPIGRTYESGPLLLHTDDDNSINIWFDVDVLEVYCLHYSEESLRKATERGALQMGIRESTRQQVARVKDKSQFLDDFKSGVYGDGGTFAHRDHVQGRYEFDEQQQ